VGSRERVRDKCCRSHPARRGSANDDGHVACVVNVVGFGAASKAIVALSWALLLLLSMGAIAWQGEGVEARLVRPAAVM
jgi:hypothetical protein